MVFVGKPGGRQVDAVIAFDVIRFGGEDRDDALIDVIFDDLPHIVFVTFNRAPLPPDFQADDHETGVVGAVFTFDGVFTGLADLRIGPDGRDHRGGVKAAPHALAVPVERAGEMVNGLLQVGIHVGENIAAGLVIDPHQDVLDRLAVADL